MTYRLISASADTYITDKYIANSRSLTSNVGQAGTLDMFKLFGETTVTGITSSVTELTRILIKFDYSSFTTLDVASPTFTASLVLKDVYGGQTVPSNFTLEAFPLSKSFDEGRGFDVISYRDVDSANFLSASTAVTWSLSGASDIGTLGADVDVIVSGDIGSGLQNLGSTFAFARGDEDARFDITSLVSASVAGIITNHGFRIAFVTAQEIDSTTRFVKRFGSRHAFNKDLHPKLHIELTDNLIDDAGRPKLDVSQSFFVYNHIDGNRINFVSASTSITGSNSLIFELISSKSVVFTTSSFQANFSASISHTTSSVTYFSSAFTASQNNSTTGIYSVDFRLDTTSDVGLQTFISNSNNLWFDGTWKSLDRSVTFAKTGFNFIKPAGEFENAEVKNYVVNAWNLKNSYTIIVEACIRVFVQDRSMAAGVAKFPKGVVPVILTNMRWRLVKAYDNDVVIPFSAATKMSTDREGMYFDMSIQDLDVNEVYELEFLITNEVGKDVHIQNKGFVFKVVI